MRTDSHSALIRHLAIASIAGQLVWFGAVVRSLPGGGLVVQPGSGLDARSR
jgi:hypothetical protein